MLNIYIHRTLTNKYIAFQHQTYTYIAYYVTNKYNGNPL